MNPITNTEKAQKAVKKPLIPTIDPLDRDRKVSAFCNDIIFVMETVGYKYNVNEWRLFSGRNKISLKTVLLHNGRKLLYVPIVYVVKLIK
ncbi:hypothetical protein Trydic_g17191 [Trypoxylus dichotomus]